MKNLIWNILALIASFVVTSSIIMAIQMISHYIFPLPANIQLTDLKDVESLTKVIPLATMLLVVLSYIIGSLAGGYVVGKGASSDHFAIAGILGCIMTGANIANIMSIPHPLWMIVVTMITFIPCALIGCYLARNGVLNNR